LDRSNLQSQAQQMDRYVLVVFLLLLLPLRGRLLRHC